MGTLEKLAKEEFLKQGRARRVGREAVATTTKATTTKATTTKATTTKATTTKTSGLWRMTRSPFLRTQRTTETKATGRNVLPANTIRTIRMKMIRMKIRIRTKRRWWFLLGRGGGNCFHWRSGEALTAEHFWVDGFQHRKFGQALAFPQQDFIAGDTSIAASTPATRGSRGR